MSRSVFYCDLIGTYKTNDEGKNQRELNLLKFAQFLEKLRKTNRDDILYFSFITTDDINAIQSCINEFLPFLKKYENIKFGTSFSESHKIIGENFDPLDSHSSGKHCQIINNLKHMMSDEYYPIHAEIDKIYFADDSLINHVIIKHVFPSITKNVKLINFILDNKLPPKDKDVYSTNETGINGILTVGNEYIKTLNKNNGVSY